jgi:hypothetical protein
MVLTLGFLSILAFAGILAVAGVITAAIFDDCLVRLRFKAVTHPAVAMCVWGAFYYAWMVRRSLIQAQTLLSDHLSLSNRCFVSATGGDHGGDHQLYASASGRYDFH